MSSSDLCRCTTDPNEAGYAIWAAALRPLLERLLPEGAAAPRHSSSSWQRASAEEKLKGVGGQNNLEFEALNKPSYQLAQAGDGEGDVDESFSLSVVDMSEVLARPDDAAARAAFAGALGASLETIGFAVLVGHGVPAALHEEAQRRTPRIFTETSEEDKAAFRAERFGAVNQGWFPREETSNLRECSNDLPQSSRRPGV